jgi:hypothetical protein
MPGIVSDATKIWEENQTWARNAQCATWDPSGRRVEVWECLRERTCCFFFLVQITSVVMLTLLVPLLDNSNKTNRVRHNSLPL